MESTKIIENMFLCIFVVLMQPKYTYGHEYIENWLYANVLKHWNYSSSPAIIILCVYIRHCQLHDVGAKVHWCYIIKNNDIINIYKHFIYKDTYLSNNTINKCRNLLLQTHGCIKILLDQKCKNTKIQTVHFETCYSILIK